MHLKKLYLLLFCCFLFQTVRSQIVTIPDVNFKNALLSHVPVINTNGDGEIQVSEALAFTGTINVSSKSIADLTGIDAFTNIQGLNFSYNQVSTLSLNNFPSLTQLNCLANRLTVLPLTNLPLLNTLAYMRCSVPLLLA